MRVLEVIQDLKPGGAERVVLALVDHLRGCGHDVAVAAAPGPWSERFDCEQFELPILARRPHRVLTGAVALARAVRSFRPDVVHAHNPGMASITALATARGHLVPAAVSVHGVAEADYAWASRVLRAAGLAVISCGPGVTAALAERGVRVHRTIVNGVPPGPSPMTREEAMTALGFTGDASVLPLVLSVGRLAEQKHHDLALRAIARVEGVAFAIVGDGPLRGDLEALVADLGLTARARLAGGRNDARALMGAADAVVLASHWEGLPLVALEAAASATPIVATSVRGIRELLTDRENALLVPADDPSVLAGAIREAVTDAGVAAQLRAGGERLAAQYTEARMLEAFGHLYEELRCPG